MINSKSYNINQNQYNKAKKYNVAFKGQILLDPYILIPTMAAYSLFHKSNEIESAHRKDTFIANNLFTASMAILFANLNRFQAIASSTFPILAGVSMLAHTNTKKSNRSKARTFVKDLNILLCGLITKNLGNRLLGNLQRFPSGPLGFIYETSSFLVGSVLLSPIVSKFVNDNITEKLYPKKKSKINLYKLYNDQSPYPEIIDSYNVTRFTSPRLFDVTKEDNPDIDD